MADEPKDRSDKAPGAPAQQADAVAKFDAKEPEKEPEKRVELDKGLLGDIVDDLLPVEGGGAEPTEAGGSIEDVSGIRVEAKDESRTRAKIAVMLTYAVIAVSSTLALVCVALLVRLLWVGGDGAVADARFDKVISLVTILLSQTLYPLATIAIGWYFASRQNDRRP